MNKIERLELAINLISGDNVTVEDDFNDCIPLNGLEVFKDIQESLELSLEVAKGTATVWVDGKPSLELYSSDVEFPLHPTLKGEL